MERTTVGSIKVDYPTRFMVKMMTPSKALWPRRLETSDVQWAHAVGGALRGGLILYIRVYRIIRTCVSRLSFKVTQHAPCACKEQNNCERRAISAQT